MLPSQFFFFVCPNFYNSLLKPWHVVTSARTAPILEAALRGGVAGRFDRFDRFVVASRGV
jgi:hypothetical protein